MRKLTYTLLFCLVAMLALIQVSCEEKLDNDHEGPEIFNLRLNMGDTIHGAKGEVIILNRKNKPYDELDTLIIGHTIDLSGQFRSNNGLNNFLVKLWGDTMLENSGDACLNIRQVISDDRFFNKRIDSMVNTNFYRAIPAELTSKKDTSEVKNLPLRQGKQHQYELHAIDVRGNISISKPKDIVIFSRDSLLKVRNLQK